MERLHRRRPRQQPYAHAGDDAEIRLREQAVEDRAEAVFRRVPVHQAVVVERSVAGAHHLAIAKHDLHAAGKAEMIEIGRVAGALVERVAEHAALRRPRGHVEHQLVAAPHQLVIHRLVAHARLDHGEAEPLVDLEDAVHPVAEIDHDLSGARSGTAAEPDIVAGADRIERHAMRVGAAHDRLHVGGRGRIDHAGGRRSPPGMVFSP